MIQATRTTPTILVTDATRGSAIAIIRSLGRQGYRVIAADSDPRSLGFRSRFVQERLVYPNPAADPQGFVATVAKAAETSAVDLIVPVTDEVILPLSAARDRFEPACRLAIPPTDSLRMTTNKCSTLELAKRLGVPTPQTAIVETADAACRAAQSFQWPVVLKPLVSRLLRNDSTIEQLTVSYAENPDRLREKMTSLEGVCPVLLQEYVRGTGFGVELLLDEGVPLAAFQHKRLREVPLNGGASAFRESVALDTDMLDYSTRLMGELKWTGLAMVEFKVGRLGPKLMEINGRVWGSLPLAVLSGMDFPARLARLYLHDRSQREIKLNTSYRVGVRARNLELDMVWIASVLFKKRRYPFLPAPGRHEAFGAMLQLLDPRSRFDILSLTDPGPGLAEIPKIVRKFFGKVGAH